MDFINGFTSAHLLVAFGQGEVSRASEDNITVISGTLVPSHLSPPQPFLPKSEVFPQIAAFYIPRLWDGGGLGEGITASGPC